MSPGFRDILAVLFIECAKYHQLGCFSGGCHFRSKGREFMGEQLVCGVAYV